MTQPEPIWAANIADATTIAVLQVEAWRWAYRGQMPDPYLERLSVTTRANMWVGALMFPGVGLLAIGPRDAPHAFVGFGPPQDPEPRPGEGEIYALYQRRESVGSGRARRLVSAVVDHYGAQGAKALIVCALKSNPTAHGFYQSQGFVRDGERSSFDADGFPLEELRFRRKLVRTR